MRFDTVNELAVSCWAVVVAVVIEPVLIEVVEILADVNEEALIVFTVKADVGADTLPPIVKAPWIARLVPTIAPGEKDPVVIGPRTERPPPIVTGPDTSTDP